MASCAGGEAQVSTGTKRKRGGRKAAVEAVSPPPAPVISKPENGSSDGPTPRKRGKSAASAAAAASVAAPVPEPVKIEEVVTTDGPETTEVKTEEHWPKLDIEMLLERLVCMMPAEDGVRYNTQADRIDWEKIRFTTYTAADCKRQWSLISTKVRRFRTMTELLVDAKNWAKQPWTSFNKKQSKHPDMPKKPLTPYFRYFMEKRAKYSQQHPDLSMTEISMVLAQRYRALQDKKKQKYIDAYNKENEQYKVLLMKFKDDHPDLYTDLGAEKSHKRGGGSNRGLPSIIAGSPGGPPKTTTPMQLYIDAKTEEHRKKDPSLSKREYYDTYKMKWAELPDSKKLKYINKAVEFKTKYDEAMEEYMVDHPEYKPKPNKSFLNKYEQKIKDKSEGKPEKPPPNGYGLFTSQVLSKLTDIPSNERMAEVSRRWKALKEEDREKFNKNSVQKMNEYKSLMAIYLRKLPEAEREKLSADGKKLLKTTKVLTPSSAQSAWPQQPVSALFLFVNEKRDKYRIKYPGMDHQELTRLIAKEYTALPADKKAKYKKLEEDHKSQVSNNSTPPTTTASHRGRSAQFPGEPRKPPGSGYQLFSTEMLIKLTAIHSQQRMAVISEKWRAMTEAQRNGYKAKREKLWAKYYIDLKKFKAGLSKTDAAKYEELELARKVKRHMPTAPKVPKKPPVPVKPEVESDDSSDDDDSDDDSDDSDNDNDSDSGTDSDDESETEPPKPVQNGPPKEAAEESDSDSGSEAETASDTSSEVSGSSESASESASASESESDDST